MKREFETINKTLHFKKKTKLCVCGNKAYSHIRNGKWKKLGLKNPWVHPYRCNEIFKAYHLYNLNTKSVIISQDVAFNEDTQNQEGAQQPEDDTFIDLQPLFWMKTKW